MAISAEGAIGIGLTLLFGAGAGAMSAWPDQVWIGKTVIALAGAGFVALGVYYFRERLTSHWRSRRTVILVALMFGVLWFDYWYSSNYSANGGIWHWHIQIGLQPPPPPAPPAPPPAPPPKPPEKPWVTDDEVEQAKKNNRVLVRYNPAELVRMVMINQRDISVYRGSWIKFSEIFQSVDIVEMTDKTKLYGVKGTMFYNPTLLFDPKKWGATLLTLKEGQHIEGMCQIVGVVERVFYLATCELN